MTTEVPFDENAEVTYYERRYTELPGLQPAGAVRYSLCGSEPCLTMVAQCSRGGQTLDRAAYPLWGVAMQAAQNLLQFCCENAVGVAQLCDVLEDACVRAELLPRGAV